jgi:hypothetical protein
MRKEILFPTITAAIVLFFATAAAATDDSRGQMQYDVKAERVFVGAVHEKPGLFEGRLYFTLWTRHGVVVVEVGPQEFVQQGGFKLEAGQMVTVVGMPVVVDNREMVLAREITRGGSVFRVRDRNGQPMWEKDRPIEMDPELGDVSMPVC